MVDVDIDPVLAEVLGPVRNRIAAIEAEITDLERQIVAKREELRPYRRVILAVDGKKPGPKSKQQKRTGRDVTRDVDQQIRKRFADGREFTSTDIYRGWEPKESRIGSTRVTECCRELHATGVIRLTRRGTGGSSIYRVVDS